MKRVVFYEVFDEEREALERHLPPDLEVLFLKETIQESGQEKPPSSVISIRTQSKIPAAWASELKAMLTRSTGYDHVRSCCKKTQATIRCGYLPSYCAQAVAQQAIIVLLALWRKLPLQMKQMADFCRDGLTGHEFSGKNLLVVGVGRIGRECVSLGRVLGMTVKGVDIDPRESVEYVSFDDGIVWADAVICALPLTDQTRGLFSLAAFMKMKKGSIFVNVSRGEVSPLADVYQAIKQGTLAGLSLDVYENEPDLAADMRKRGRSKEIEILKELELRYNVMLTPHNAFNTQEALERKARQSVESLVSFFETGRFLWEPPVE